MFACWAVACRPLLSLEIWPPVWDRNSLFSARKSAALSQPGVPKEKGKSAACLFRYYSGMKSLNFLTFLGVNELRV